MLSLSMFPVPIPINLLIHLYIYQYTLSKDPLYMLTIIYLHVSFPVFFD